MTDRPIFRLDRSSIERTVFGIAQIKQGNYFPSPAVWRHPPKTNFEVSPSLPSVFLIVTLQGRQIHR
jgi:hypothetical protein